MAAVRPGKAVCHRLSVRSARRTSDGKREVDKLGVHTGLQDWVESAECLEERSHRVVRRSPHGGRPRCCAPAPIFSAVLAVPALTDIGIPVDCPVCTTPSALTPEWLVALRDHLRRGAAVERAPHEARTGSGRRSKRLAAFSRRQWPLFRRLAPGPPSRSDSLASRWQPQIRAERDPALVRRRSSRGRPHRRHGGHRGRAGAPGGSERGSPERRTAKGRRRRRSRRGHAGRDRRAGAPSSRTARW